MNQSPLPVESVFDFIKVLDTRNIDTLVPFVDNNARLEDRDKYVYIVSQLVGTSAEQMSNLMTQLYIAFAADITRQLCDQFDPQEFNNDFDADSIRSSYGTFMVELVNRECADSTSSSTESTTVQTLVNQFIDTLSIKQLIGYIRTIAMGKTNEAKDTEGHERAALVCDTLYKQYPKLFEIDCDLFEEPIELMDYERWGDEFIRFIEKIISNQ